MSCDNYQPFRFLSGIKLTPEELQDIASLKNQFLEQFPAVAEYVSSAEHVAVAPEKKETP